MPKLPQKIHTAAETLWNYHRLSMNAPQQADILLVAGSHDLEVAKKGAELALNGTYNEIVVSGGAGKVTSGTFAQPEAVIFKQIMVEKGVDKERIIVEDQARNSGENITLTHQLLGEKATRVRSGLLVTKPYMERRLLATAMKQWPEVLWTVTSPDLNLADYLSTPEAAQRTIELMVGDLQRIDTYATKGFQVPQGIPANVWEAFTVLVDAGYDAQVTKE